MNKYIKPTISVVIIAQADIITTSTLSVKAQTTNLTTNGFKKISTLNS